MVGSTEETESSKEVTRRIGSKAHLTSFQQHTATHVHSSSAASSWDDLKRQIAALAQEAQAWKTKADEAEHARERAEKNEQDAQKKLLSLHEDVVNTIETCKASEQQLNDQDSKIDHLFNEVESIRNSKVSHRFNLQGEEEMCERVEKECMQLKNEAKNAFEDAKAAVQKAETFRSETHEELESLRSKCETSEASIKQLNEEKSQAEQSNAELEQRCQSLHAWSRQLEEEKDTLHHGRDQAIYELERLSKRKNDLEDTLFAYSSDLQREREAHYAAASSYSVMKGRASKAEKLLSQSSLLSQALATALQWKEGAYKQLWDELCQRSHDNAQITASLKAMETQLASLERERNVQTSKAEALQTSLHDAQCCNDRLVQQVQRLKDSTQTLHQENEKHMEKMRQRCKEEAEAMRKDRDLMSEQLTEAKQTINELHQQRKETEESHKEQCSHLEKRVHDVEHQLEQTKAEAESVKETLQQKDQELEESKEALKSANEDRSRLEEATEKKFQAAADAIHTLQCSMDNPSDNITLGNEVDSPLAGSLQTLKDKISSKLSKAQNPLRAERATQVSPSGKENEEHQLEPSIYMRERDASNVPKEHIDAVDAVLGFESVDINDNQSEGVYEQENKRHTKTVQAAQEFNSAIEPECDAFAYPSTSLHAQDGNREQSATQRKQTNVQGRKRAQNRSRTRKQAAQRRSTQRRKTPQQRTANRKRKADEEENLHYAEASEQNKRPCTRSQRREQTEHGVQQQLKEDQQPDQVNSSKPEEDARNDSRVHSGKGGREELHGENRDQQQHVSQPVEDVRFNCWAFANEPSEYSLDAEALFSQFMVG